MKLELELTDEEKRWLDELVWYHLASLASLGQVRPLLDYERRDLEIYKSIYTKLGNEIEDWVEEVK
jgi:hypothetical protein